MAAATRKPTNSPTKEQQPNKFTDIGALWRAKSDTKVKLTGQLRMEGRDGPVLKILIIANDKGDNPKRPDFRVVMVEDEPMTDDKNRGQKPVPGTDDIPF